LLGDGCAEITGDTRGGSETLDHRIVRGPGIEEGTSSGPAAHSICQL
jgi:hypothetical protein